MQTQYQAALEGRVTDAMTAAAAREDVAPRIVCREIASGRAVLPANPSHHNAQPAVIGRRFRTKINANLGYSPERSCLEDERAKLTMALDLGADCIMDLSVGADLDDVRQAFLDTCHAPLGTVPIYEALSRVNGNISRLSITVLLDVIRDQARQGVDFMTLHAGLLREHVALAMRRRLGIVSRGGAILARWMAQTGSQNPLYEEWDAVLSICREHDVTLSLGDGLRPGCLADAGDKAQYGELDVLGALVDRCREAGVQVMVEGPGHVPLDQIPSQMERQRRVCKDAPFYVLGPIVTDIAPGYDHITSCIGATLAAWHGATLLCYVTPAEHLGLPTLEDVRQGVVAYRIAAHAADVARGLPGARDRDDAMADARRNFDWEGQFALALDGGAARERYRSASRTSSSLDAEDFCSMCGKDFCAVRNSRELARESAT